MNKIDKAATYKELILRMHNMHSGMNWVHGRHGLLPDILVMDKRMHRDQVANSRFFHNREGVNRGKAKGYTVRAVDLSRFLSSEC